MKKTKTRKQTEMRDGISEIEQKRNDRKMASAVKIYSAMKAGDGIRKLLQRRWASNNRIFADG